MRPEDLLRPTPAGPLLPARRFLHRSGAAGRPRADHPWPFRPRPARPRCGPGDAARRSTSWRIRIGDDFCGATAGGQLWRERTEINGVSVTLHPAGHVLGSAQIAVEMGGTPHRRFGRLQAPARSDGATFEPVPCDVFITEATFGLPVFRHPDPTRRNRQAADSARGSFPPAPISSASMRSARRSA